MDKMAGSVIWRSERQIEQLANMVRRELGIGPGDRLAMQPVLEFALDEMVPGAYFAVANDHDMPGAEGRTDWHQPVITIAASTYANLKKSDPRARMTVAHEIGHLLMHTQQPIFHYRSKSRDHRVDPEWQANYFAAALLMPATAFRKMRTVKQARSAFGVSKAAALRRARILGHKILDDTVRQSPSKRKGHGVNRTP